MTPGRRPLPAILVCALACAWTALVFAAPALGSSSGGIGLRLSAAAYLAGSVVCHQRAERSFHAAGAQLPVCARCTGLYVGGTLGLLIGIVIPALRLAAPLAGLGRRWAWRGVLVATSLPLVTTVALEWARVSAVGNGWRAATAIPAAWAVGAMIAESLSFRVTL